MVLTCEKPEMSELKKCDIPEKNEPKNDENPLKKEVCDGYCKTTVVVG